LLLRKHFPLLVMLETVVLLNIFVIFFFKFFFQVYKFLQVLFLIDFHCNHVEVFVVTFDQFGVSWLNKRNKKIKRHY